MENESFLEKQNEKTEEKEAKEESNLNDVSNAVEDEVCEQNKILNNIVKLFLIFFNFLRIRDSLQIKDYLQH